MTKEKAVSRCTDLGGKLPSFHTDADHTFLTNKLVERDIPFIWLNVDYNSATKEYRWGDDHSVLDRADKHWLSGFPRDKGYTLMYGNKGSEKQGKIKDNGSDDTNYVTCVKYNTGE